MIPMWLIRNSKEPRRTFIFRRTSKIWMNVYFPLVGCWLTIRGRENFKSGENYIVISNHNSLMDVPITTPEIPGGNKTIAKIEMAKVPLFGMIYRIGSILVDRKDKNSRRESFNKMKQVLELGLHMCIYPEGTRNKTSEPLKEFHDGAFKLAVETKKPLLPAIIFNTRKVLPADKKFFFWPSRMELHFLEPRYIKTNDDVETLKYEMFDIMKRYYAARAED
jgi:1-acyl-sn-glycerol-3-phosphate acyltransferase